MTARKSYVPHVIAAAVGIALWYVTASASGRREAWDASSYWTFAYPIAMLASAWMGYRYPQASWRWPLTLFEAQFFAQCVRNGELGNLWPLGMLLFAVIAVPGIVAARLAARFSTAAEEP